MATDRNAAIGNWSEFFNIAEHSFGMKSLFASIFSLVIGPRPDRLFVCCKIANGRIFLLLEQHSLFKMETSSLLIGANFIAENINASG